MLVNIFYVQSVIFEILTGIPRKVFWCMKPCSTLPMFMVWVCNPRPDSLYYEARGHIFTLTVCCNKTRIVLQRNNGARSCNHWCSGKAVSATYSLCVFVKVKVKWSRYRPGVTQRVGRGIALLFLDRGTRRVWVVSSTPRPYFTPGKDPVPILQEAGWVPRPVWTGGKSRLHRD